MVLGKRAQAIRYCRGQSGASGASGIRALLRAGQFGLGQGALLYSPRHFSSGAVNRFGGRGRARPGVGAGLIMLRGGRARARARAGHGKT